MVIQQSMARIASFYHVSAAIPLANRGDFFNTHRRFHSEPLPGLGRVPPGVELGEMGMFQQLAVHVHRPSHEGFIRIVERPVGVPKNQTSPFGASGNSPQSKVMIARPSSIIGAVKTSFAPRGSMRRPSTKGQLVISFAGIESLVASTAHASSARAMNVFRCSADQRPSSVSLKSETTAHTRQDATPSDSHNVLASPLDRAASMRCLRKIPRATSYAQKPRSTYVTDCVWLTNRISQCGLHQL